MPDASVTPLYGSTTTFVGEAAHLLEDDEVDALVAKRKDEDDDEEEGDES